MRATSLPRNSGNSNGSNPPVAGTGRKESTSFEHSEPLPGNLTRWPRPERRPADCVELTVTLHRHDSGFGFRIVGGTEEGSQVINPLIFKFSKSEIFPHFVSRSVKKYLA